MVLVGRQDERRRLRDLLAAARRGTSGVVVIRGEPGIGKTALLDHACARARSSGMAVLRMTGVEDEAELAFAGLSELLGPVVCAGVLDRLPEPRAAALRSALALESGTSNPLAVRLALLSLLATLADDEPVLVAVDDAQWVDEPSLAALAFAARRLAAEGVAVVIAARDTWSTSLGLSADADLVLGGLADDEARQLLVDRAAADVDGLVRLASGNPLALLELPAGVDDTDGWDGVRPPPVGPRVHAAFRHRLDGLDDDARLAVGVMAADGTARLGDVLRAFELLGLTPGSLQPAERAGLVLLDGDRACLRHPLLRSVGYHGLEAPDRRRVHAALAEVLERRGDGERCTWHRAAAAVGPDEDVAKALEAVAARAEERGALATTAHGLARAAGLTADDDTRARRLRASADAWQAAGHWDIALTRLDEAATYARDPRVKADVASLAGQLVAYRAGPEAGAGMLVEAAEAIEPIDPVRATHLLSCAVNVAVFAADVDQAVELAGRASVVGERAGGLSAVSGAMARVEAGLLAADPGVPDLLEPVAAVAEAVIESDLGDAERVFSLVVLADMTLENWDRAESLLDVMVRRSHTTGRLFLLALALTVRGEIAWRRGRWAEAYSTVTTEMWATPIDVPAVGAALRAVQARVEAGLGLSDEAEAHGRAALAAARETGTHAMAAWAGASLGFLELGRGRPDAAVAHLEEVAATLDGGGVAEPGILWWAADLVEALWLMGDQVEAARRLDLLTAQADATGRVWAHAAAARCAGLLARSADEAEDAFAEALRRHDHLDAPFERARTLLRLAERRQAHGSPGGHHPARDALATFERLGAEPWAAQARSVLGDLAPAAPAVVPLTRQEREVASIVAVGATNREAADRLFLSPRTIDFHLRNIYRKLQVRSRTELAALLAARPPL